MPECSLTKGDILTSLIMVLITINQNGYMVGCLQECVRRGLKVVVAGIPKTIDNDIDVSLPLKKHNAFYDGVYKQRIWFNNLERFITRVVI